jgi:hypothetical protein
MKDRTQSKQWGAVNAYTTIELLLSKLVPVATVMHATGEMA